MTLNRNALWKDPKIVARFWKYANIQEGCWPWTGVTNGRGYGKLQVQRGKIRKQVRAHCLGWQIANKSDWPEGMFGCHSCDNPICVNPEHIRPGTYLDNTRDCIERGRSFARGASNRNKTHCNRGHPYSGENLRIARNGTRGCRTCIRMWATEYKRRKKGKS